MSLFIYYDGVDISANVDLSRGLPGFTTQADGATVSFAGLQVDDPTGALNLVGLQPFHIVETECSQPRIFTGWAWDRSVGRDTKRVSAGRIWDCNIGDINLALQFRPIRETAANRPAETDLARLTWLLSSDSMAGLIYNNGGVNLTDNPQTLDAADLRGQYPNEVLQDIGSVLFGKQYFLYWDNSAPSGHEVSLFYDVPTATFRTSTLTISNVLSDVSRDTTGTVTGTCYPPSVDGRLTRSPEDTYSGVYLTTLLGTSYLNDPTTEAAFIRREISVDQSRIGSTTTRDAYLTQFLDRSGIESDTITCSVILPASKVNLIDSGMRIGVRFSHLPGYDTQQFMRVVSRTPSRSINELGDQWLLELTLSSQPPVGGSGGSGGGSGVGVGSSGGGSGTGSGSDCGCDDFVLSCTGGEGAELSHDLFERTTDPTSGAAAWTGSNDTNTTGLFWRVDGPANVAFIDGHDAYLAGAAPFTYVSEAWLATSASSSSGAHYRLDISGGAAFHWKLVNLRLANLAGTVSGTGRGFYWYLGTNVGASAFYYVRCESDGTFEIGKSLTGGFPGTTLASGTFGADIDLEITANGATINVNGVTATASPAIFKGELDFLLIGGPSGSNPTALIGAVYQFDASSELICNSPSSGQRILNEAGGTGDGSTTTFSTDYPYKAGSITVRVNGINVTDSVASFDPGTGTVTFAHAPATGAEITFDYKAA